MLSRTADHLYWMSRYIERAESLARLVDAHYRMSLLPHSPDALALSLSSTMTALHMEEAYNDKHDTIEPRAVFEFVSLDREFSGSIISCLRAARENARAVRGSLTSELWETLNSTWLDARALIARNGPNRDIGQFVEWVKERSHLTRGVTIGTMLRDEAFHFTRIGTFLERADSTARILTAHQTDLKPGADAGAVPDPFEWSVLLRALSAFEVYRMGAKGLRSSCDKVAKKTSLRKSASSNAVSASTILVKSIKVTNTPVTAPSGSRYGKMRIM